MPMLFVALRAVRQAKFVQCEASAFAPWHGNV
jgi:hypothetical protein